MLGLVIFSLVLGITLGKMGENGKVKQILNNIKF
jgi:Na+/H+-dicarboxylate symporter